MFPNLGMSELVLILVIAMIVFGPSKLPEMGKALGRTMTEFRRASAASFQDFEAVSDEVKQVKEEVVQAANAMKENIAQDKISKDVVAKECVDKEKLN
jgi:sec-independent protein translocase protein TatA